jgi:predicted ATP-grasp superfamily ATP-dependent carboligase
MKDELIETICTEFWAEYIDRDIVLKNRNYIVYINPRYINSAYHINKNNVEYMKVLVGNTRHTMVLSEYQKLIAE